MLQRDKRLRQEQYQQDRHGEKGLPAPAFPGQADQQPADRQQDAQSDQARPYQVLNILVMKIISQKSQLFLLRIAGIHLRSDIFLVQQILAIARADPLDPGMVLIQYLESEMPFDQPQLNSVEIRGPGKFFFPDHADIPIDDIQVPVLDGIIREDDARDQQQAGDDQGQDEFFIFPDGITLEGEMYEDEEEHHQQQLGGQQDNDPRKKKDHTDPQSTFHLGG